MIAFRMFLLLLILISTSVLGAKDRTERIWNSSAASPTLGWVFKATQEFDQQLLTNLLDRRDFPCRFNFHQIEANHFLMVFNCRKEKAVKLPTRRHLEMLTYGNGGKFLKAYFHKISRHVKLVLENHAAVEWFSQQILRPRFKRSLFNDPVLKKQWHLVSTVEFPILCSLGQKCMTCLYDFVLCRMKGCFFLFVNLLVL